MFQFISNLIIIFIRCYSRIIWKLILQHHLMHNYLNSYLSSVYTQYNTVILISLNHLSWELSLGLQVRIFLHTQILLCRFTQCHLKRALILTANFHFIHPFDQFPSFLGYTSLIYSISRMVHLLATVHVTYIANIPCFISLFGIEATFFDFPTLKLT